MDSTPNTLNPETTNHTPEEQKQQQQPETAPIQQQRTRQQQQINPYKNNEQRSIQSRSNNQRYGVQQAYEPLNHSSDYADDEETVPYKPESAKNPQDTDLESGLQLSMRLKQNVVQASSFAEQTFPMLVSLLVDDGNTASRAPIDLVCVIDVSGSMRGEKIQLVNCAFQYLLNYLDDSDRLSIIIFNSNAHRVLPLLRMNENNKHKVKSAIGQITASGGTSINSGMVQAFEVLKQRRHVNPVTSIFLLSDGLNGRAQDQVKYSLSQYSTLDDVTIHTFGFGNDHDSQLMSDIADLRDGNFYFIKELSTIDQAFVDCLGGLLSSVAQSVEIKIKPEQSEALKGVEIVKALGEESMWKQENQVFTTKMLSLMSGKQKDFVLELKIPTCTKELTDNEKNVQVASAEVHIVDLKNKLVVRKTDLKITILNEVEEIKEEDQEEADKDVMTNFFRLKSASLMSEARALAELNKHEEAKKILMNFKEELENSFLKNEEVIKILIQDMEKAMTYVNPQVYQKSGKHGLKNNSRAYAHQKTNFDSNNRFQNRKQVDMMEQLQVLKNQ